jgi:hypothetical protein
VDPLAEWVDRFPDVEHGSRREPFTELIPQPDQMSGIGLGRARGCLDLQSDDGPVRALQDHVDLTPAILLT